MMDTNEAIKLLKGMQGPLQDYADMVGAPESTKGIRYVYPDPEDYAIEAAISALEEQDKYRWIPVEERLPEESLNSVIGWDEYRERCCFVQYYAGSWHLGDESVRIIAWMPLPEAYQPEE